MDLSITRDSCQSCQTICAETAVHCLVKAEPHPRDLVRLLWDCSEICGTTANFLSRGSSLRAELCRACASVCNGCAEACRIRGDAILQRCAETCRDCARRCREVAEAETL